MLDTSSTPDEYEKFFKELGSGSAKQVPTAVDDDQEFEKKETVNTPILNYIEVSTFYIFTFLGIACFVQNIRRARWQNRVRTDQPKASRSVTTENWRKFVSQ